MAKLFQALLAAAVAAFLLSVGPAAGKGTVVASTNELYAACGRVFSDPHAYWPTSPQAPARSPFAKGNAACASVDFLAYGDMVAGVEQVERLFPRFVEFYELEQDFGGKADCATSTSSESFCSAGLPRQGVTMQRVRSDLYMLRITDERVSDTNKKFFTFPLSIHGIERAGAEAGVRAAEDLATWAYCEAVGAGTETANGLTNCAREGAIPHPLLETQPASSISAGRALRESAIYFVFANPDGWRRGDPDNLTRFYQRYNGNGVDMNRDWPTIGFTFRPYTPWSEPETRAFGKVMKQIRPTWAGGIDLHGQLVDRAFSFTLLGAGQHDYAKDQRILQTVKGAWTDAEARLAWSPLIKPNNAPADDERLYGVQWGTVWDTIGYTTTGSLGDWIDSPLGLNADGVDNEMSLSHISNCGTGTCYLIDAEQLHIDGNKSLVYAMVNFTLLPEDQTFEVPAGKVAYLVNVSKSARSGERPAPPPGKGFSPQAPILDVSLDEGNGFTYEFVAKGFDDGIYNGGLEGTATAVNVGGITTTRDTTAIVLERYRAEESQTEDSGCGEGGDRWVEVNRYFNQSSLYQQAGQAVHTNMPLPGRWRICMAGSVLGSGGRFDLDITFSAERAWEDPVQRGYSVRNTRFFEDLARYIAPAELVRVKANDVLAGAVDLTQFSSLVIADNAFPGYVEPIPTGPAQAGLSFDARVATAATVPCAYSPGTQDVLPPTCAADFEYDVDPDRQFNNQSMTVKVTAPDAIDYDLYIERRSVLTGEWFGVGQSATGSATEETTILKPPPGRYRARVVNWSGGVPAEEVSVSFSNTYQGPPLGPNSRTDKTRDAWGAKLRAFVEGGGNLVLTDGALTNLAHMKLVERRFIRDFSVYAGYIGFTRDGVASTYADPLAANVNQPGAAEGRQFRHQTYEPVPLGYAISPPDDDTDLSTSPVWTIDQSEWERLPTRRTVGITTADQVSLGELTLGKGVVRVIGAVLPNPTQQYYHPFGLANYAVTYSGYQVLKNSLQWSRPA